jgi:hypothetical protein
MIATVNDLLQTAQQQSSLDNFGDDWFMGPLAAYVSDLDAPAPRYYTICWPCTGERATCPGGN